MKQTLKNESMVVIATMKTLMLQEMHLTIKSLTIIWVRFKRMLDKKILGLRWWMIWAGLRMLLMKC